MHYCDTNFKTKKALKDAVAARIAAPGIAPPVTVHNPETFGGGPETPKNGRVAVGGPHFPQPHVWYAEVTIVNGEVVKVK